MTDVSAGFLVTASRVWDGVSADPINEGFVRVDGAHVTAVGRRADLGSDPGLPVIELPGATVLPGLINAHTHLTFNASMTVLPDLLREREAGEGMLAIRAVDNMRRALGAGVTTIRDCGTANAVA